MLEEELKGNQHKIDVNKNNKVDAHDFKLLRAQKEKEKANSMKHGKEVKEETELNESHFKVGDEVVCKASGMEGEVIKVDPKGEGKYYTVKQEDGTIKKFAPNELKKEDEEEMKEATKEQETKFHKQLDTLVHKTFGKRKEEMKEDAEQNDKTILEYESKDGVFRHAAKLASGMKYGKTVWKKDKLDKPEPSTTDLAKIEKQKKKFSEMIETYKEGGLKTISEMFIKEEPSQEEFNKEIEEVKKKASEKKSPEDEARVAKGSVQAVKVEEEVELDEREMTDAEMKKREDIVKGMKKGMAGFKQRYGDRAKQVMYATATKTAMKD
jgi:preprotein translocase subunit YajC